MIDNFKFSLITLSFVLTTILVFLSEWIQETGIISFPLGFRHLMISFIIVINWFFFGKNLKLEKTYALVIIIIIVYLFTAFFFSKASIFNYVLGFFFSFLFMFLFIFSSNTKTSKNVIINIFKYLLYFFSVISIISIFQSLSAGASLREYSGLFRELGAFGSVMNISTIISISLYLITSKKIFLYLAMFFSIGVMMTILKKTMISNIFVWLFYFFYQSNTKNKLKLVFIFVLISFSSFFLIGEELSKDIDNNSSYLEGVGPTEHVRLGMFIASFNIDTDYFPFGSGLGTFGSLSSIMGGYSIVHYDYGVAYIGSNSPEDIVRGSHTLLDTYWPHIFGELGFLGTILFLIIWLFPFKKAFRNFKVSDDPFVKGVSFYVLMVLICITWEGFTLYTPEIPSFVLLHSGLSGLCYYHLKTQKKNFREVS
jgi:hypothetical protein